MYTYSFFFARTNIDDEHSEDHVIALVSALLEKGPATKQELFDQISGYYKGEKLNYSAFKRMLNDYFECVDNKYLKHNELQDKPNDIADDYFSCVFASELQPLTEFSLDELYDQFNNLDDSQKSLYIHNGVLLVNAIEIKLNSISFEYGISVCKDIEININEYLTRLRNAIKSIYCDNSNIQVSSFVKSSIVQKYLLANGIQDASDLISAPTELLLILCSIDYKSTVMGIESLSGNYLEYLCKYIDTALLELSDREYFVLLNRNGYFVEDGKTLEATASEYGLTRERIRQIESKANKKLKRIAPNLKDELQNAVELILKSVNADYIYLPEFISDENSRYIYCICLLLNHAEIIYIYNSRYNIIFDSSAISITDIEDQVISKFGKLFSVNKLSDANQFELQIIRNNYVVSGKEANLYRLRHYSQTEFLIDLVDEMFPLGYRCYNDDDYLELRDEYEKRLGDDVVPSKTAVRGIVSRDSFCLVNRGTYCLRCKCVELPSDLRNRIYDFIIDHLPTVEYITIYESFKPELNALGINNYYYLKGVLDPTLPDDFNTQRDYITEAGNAISANESRITFMRSFSGPFSFEDLKQRFPGVRITVFQLLCYDETQNGLLVLGQQRFIYADNLNISQDSIALLKKNIDDLLNLSQDKVVSSRKLFARIKLYYPALLDELVHIDNQVAMYSLAKYLFANEYYYDRPFISLEKPDADRITIRGLIRDHLEELTSFDYEEYKNFCMRMNIPMAYTYVQLIDEFSDDFVQIENRRLIRKDSFEMAQDTLNGIGDILELIFKRTKVIETSRFNGYMMFPQIKHKWNKHVLAGIVRSYLSDRYEVINITDASVSEPVDYEIVRCTI